jgi:ribose transport system substrate-binding protein
MIRRRRSIAAALGLMLLCGLIAACGSNNKNSTSGPSGASSTTSSASGSNLPDLAAIYRGSEHAPPATSPPPAKHKSVWWINCGAAAAGCNDPAKAGIEAGKALGWRMTDYDAAFVNQSKGIRAAIAAKADAIITHGMTCDSNMQAVKEARAAGIAMLNMEHLDCTGQKLFNVPFIPNKTTPDWPHYFSDAWGKPEVEYAIAKTKGNLKAIIADDIDGFAKTVTDGQNAAMAECSTCKIVDTVKFGAAQLSDGTLTAKFKTALTAHPEANAVIYPYDTVVSLAGLSKAIKQAGRTDMIVVSEGGYAPTMDLIRKGGEGLTAVNANSAGIVGYSAIDALNRYFQGTPPRPEGLGFRMIDAEHGMPPTGGYVSPLPYKALFKKAWAAGVEKPTK